MIWVEILSRHHDVVARYRCEDGARIGRAYDNDVVVDDPYVAPHHARIVRDEAGELFAEDLGSVNGLYAGFVVNDPTLAEHPVHRDVRRPGGILYREGIAKTAQFSRACNDDGIPIVWIQDISGFDIGPEAERQGLLGYGSSLIYTNSTNSVPMFTILLRKASGAGYYAMAGMPYRPVLQLATPLTRLAVIPDLVNVQLQQSTLTKLGTAQAVHFVIVADVRRPGGGS